MWGSCITVALHQITQFVAVSSNILTQIPLVSVSHFTRQSLWILSSVVSYWKTVPKILCSENLSKPNCSPCFPCIAQLCSDASSGLLTCVVFSPRYWGTSCWVFMRFLSGLEWSWFSWICGLWSREKHYFKNTTTSSFSAQSHVISLETFSLKLRCLNHKSK